MSWPGPRRLRGTPPSRPDEDLGGLTIILVNPIRYLDIAVAIDDIDQEAATEAKLVLVRRICGQCADRRSGGHQGSAGALERVLRAHRRTPRGNRGQAPRCGASPWKARKHTPREPRRPRRLLSRDFTARFRRSFKSSPLSGICVIGQKRLRRPKRLAKEWRAKREPARAALGE